MPLRITSAPVSGIKKRKSSARGTGASPFASHARSKPSARKAAHDAGKSRSDAGDLDDGAMSDSEPLPDVGTSRHIAETAALQDALSTMRHIKASMFEDLPERAGMNSTRIAQVLNLRRSLPPLVSVAHVHTLLQAPTQVEREIVSLVQTGRLRRLIVPGRGNDAAGLGDCLVLTEDLHDLVQNSTKLDQSLKDRFLRKLDEMSNTSAMPAMAFTTEESMALVRAGFLVSASSLSKGFLNVASIPATFASHGDDDGTIPVQPRSESGADGRDAPQSRAATLFLSLPNTGPYLRLLSTGRSHLLALLKKSKYHEAPLTLLRDRWDGAVETDRSFFLAKRARGETFGVLPGRTKKWKDLYGMNFRWILEEAVGAGLVEIFDTGSVGPGVRCL